MKKYKCKERNCNNEICYNTFVYGQGRCGSCSQKGKRNSLYGNGRTCSQLIKQKIAISMKGKNKGNKNGMFGAHRFGKNAPNYIHGKSSFIYYPLGWTKTFKEQIRYRDKYKCQICGCSQIECSRKLDVHHIDYDKKNLDKNNLISLCHSCHMKTNGNRDYWKNILNKTSYR